MQRATATSVVLAPRSLRAVGGAGVVAGRGATALAATGRSGSLLERMMDTGAGFVLVVLPIVIGAGWFLLVRRHADVFAIAPVMVVTVNAVMAMPFAVARHQARPRRGGGTARPAVRGARHFRLDAAETHRLAGSEAGTRHGRRLRHGSVAGRSRRGRTVRQRFRADAALSASGTAWAATARRMPAGVALLLGLLCLALMMVADRFGREPASMTGDPRPAFALKACASAIPDMEMLFDADITPAAITAVMGPSGSGKSTLLDLIAGFRPRRRDAC